MAAICLAAICKGFLVAGKGSPTVLAKRILSSFVTGRSCITTCTNKRSRGVG